MRTESDAADGESGCRRDVDAVVRDVDGVTADAVDRAAGAGVATSNVGRDDDHTVYEVTGVDCRTCAGLVEAVISAREGVSNVTATVGHGTVRVDYDADTIGPSPLRTALDDLGYPVETTDEAFENRRAAQWREARLVTGVLAGLMALAPYAAVVYPTRFSFWPAHPRVVALLERALETAFATHFYINIALLAGIVLFVTGKPLLESAVVSARNHRPDTTLAIGAVAVGLYAYSSLTAFLVAGGVYYDMVIVLVVGATVWRQAHRETAPAGSAAPQSHEAAAGTPSEAD
jgi:Cu2+-exporting ATPase